MELEKAKSGFAISINQNNFYLFQYDKNYPERTKLQIAQIT